MLETSGLIRDVAQEDAVSTVLEKSGRAMDCSGQPLRSLSGDIHRLPVQHCYMRTVRRKIRPSRPLFFTFIPLT
jgi:hypothetical protein